MTRVASLLVSVILVGSQNSVAQVPSPPDCGGHTVSWQSVLVFKTRGDVPDSMKVAEELGPALANGLDGRVRTLRGFRGEPEPLDLQKQYAATWLCANAIIQNERVEESGHMCQVGAEVKPCPARIRMEPVAVWLEKRN